jgi:hypothetical protein
MDSRRTPKTASCLYMLGFLSGLAFIILCGSSAAYNSLSNARSGNNPADDVVNAPPQNTLPQAVDNVDISFGRTEQGDEFTVRALDIEPDTQVSIKMQTGVSPSSSGR